MSHDTISRQEAIDAVMKYCLQYDLRDLLAELEVMPSVQPEIIRCIEIIKRLPSVQPEIIRCRDCKHWDKTWTNDWSPDYHYCPMIDGVCKGDFYCADAERRTDG